MALDQSCFTVKERVGRLSNHIKNAGLPEGEFVAML